MHLKLPNSAKLVLQVNIGERRRAWGSVEPGSVIFYEHDLRDCLWIRAALDFFGPEPVHAQFGTAQTYKNDIR